MTDPLYAFLERQPGLVIVNLWEDYADACQAMEKVMARLEGESPVDLKILRLKLSENRQWATEHEVRGTPTLLIFINGNQVLRLRGNVAYDYLVERLTELLERTG